MPLGSETSDELLIKRAADGSESAFEELMGKHMRVLYSYIALRAPEADAADILQETMLAAWRGIPDFDGESSLKTWLFSIAKRKICDFYRGRGRIVRSECALPNEDVESNENDSTVGQAITDPAVEISVRLDAADAIKSLNKTERELIFMVFEAGLSYAQISEVTGIPVGTIKSRISAIKTKLKRFLGEDYDTL